MGKIGIIPESTRMRSAAFSKQVALPVQPIARIATAGVMSRNDGLLARRGDGPKCGKPPPPPWTKGGLTGGTALPNGFVLS
jgi:hypothetical protein